MGILKFFWNPNKVQITNKYNIYLTVGLRILGFI